MAMGAGKIAGKAFGFAKSKRAKRALINDNSNFNIELEKAFYTLNIDKKSSDKDIKSSLL